MTCTVMQAYQHHQQTPVTPGQIALVSFADADCTKTKWSANTTLALAIDEMAKKARKAPKTHLAPTDEKSSARRRERCVLRIPDSTQLDPTHNIERYSVEQ